MEHQSTYPVKLMILGSGELGREITISAKRLGNYVIAVDKYANAPAMQVADTFEIINMLDGEELEKIIRKHNPNFIIPEIEAIRTEKLRELEREGFSIIPTAEATFLTMDRVAIRELANKDLGLKTASYAFANGASELKEKILNGIGFPCVVKPVMSSSGKGQSTIKNMEGIEKAWDYATNSMRGDQKRVIVEEFISFDSEITLLTIRQRNGETIFVKPIGHLQVDGDYRESWMPAVLNLDTLNKAKEMAKKITNKLGGAGLFGVEFFIRGNEVIFSELSPRPHDTGMVTLISQDLSEFDLHIRAILGLPIPKINYYPGYFATAVILANKESQTVSYQGLDLALEVEDTHIRIFNKPETRPNRRMGVSLAQGSSLVEARSKAQKSAHSVKILYSAENK
jgi:phosphoribosylglycinamide formyltransferase 2